MPFGDQTGPDGRGPMAGCGNRLGKRNRIRGGARAGGRAVSTTREPAIPEAVPATGAHREFEGLKAELDRIRTVLDDLQRQIHDLTLPMK
jgi:hypothetical protein